MKRILSLITVLAVLLGISFASVSNINGFGLVAEAYENNYQPKVVDLTTREDFGFGINTHSKSYAAYPEDLLDEQIHAVAKSGCKWIRMNLSVPEDGDWSYNDMQVGLANKYGLKIIGTISPSRTVNDEYITLYCETIATRYNGEEGRGYVDVFQVWNEVDLILLTAKWGGSAPSGRSESDYFDISVAGPDNDLIDWLAYFKAAEKGIHSEESNSAYMTNFSYLHYGFLSYMLRNGVKFDYIGCDWYATQSKDLEKTREATKNALDYFESDIVGKYNVPVLICETNIDARNAAYDNQTLEDHQALIDMMYMYYERSWIKAAIFYELLDEPSMKTSSMPYEAYFGLISNPEGGIGVTDSKYEKPIYKEIQRLLKGNPNLTLIDRSELDLKPYEKLVVDTADDSNINKDNEDNNSDVIESFPEINWETETEDIPVKDTFTDETDSEVEEVIIENVITPVKNIKSKETSYKMPWGFVIGASTGLIVLTTGIIIAYLLISKKKLKK